MVNILIFIAIILFIEVDIAFIIFIKMLYDSWKKKRKKITKKMNS